jgi:hypothetical protein
VRTVSRSKDGVVGQLKCEPGQMRLSNVPEESGRQPLAVAGTDAGIVIMRRFEEQPEISGA